MRLKTGILPKYIASEYLKILFLCVAGITILVLVSEFFDEIKTLLDFKAGVFVVLQYFSYKIPLYALKFAPIATLLAVMILFNIMGKNNEITAMKTSGMSLARIILPVLVISTLVSFLSLFFNETFAAKMYYNSKVIKQRGILKTQYSEAEVKSNLAYKSPFQDWIAYIKFFNGEMGVMRGISIIYTDGKNNMIKRMDAEEARWSGIEWVFSNCRIREFFLKDGRHSEKTVFLKNLVSGIKETPVDFSKKKRRPEEFTLSELNGEIMKLKASGAKFNEELMNYHFMISFAFANIIMAVLGIAFSFSTGKYSGILLSFALCILTAVIYYIVLGICESIGRNNVLPAWIAAWIGNGLFFLIGTALIIRNRS